MGKRNTISPPAQSPCRCASFIIPQGLKEKYVTVTRPAEKSYLSYTSLNLNRGIFWLSILMKYEFE